MRFAPLDTQLKCLEVNNLKENLLALTEALFEVKSEANPFIDQSNSKTFLIVLPSVNRIISQPINRNFIKSVFHANPSKTPRKILCIRNFSCTKFGLMSFRKSIKLIQTKANDLEQGFKANREEKSTVQ